MAVHPGLVVPDCHPGAEPISSIPRLKLKFTGTNSDDFALGGKTLVFNKTWSSGTVEGELSEYL